VPALNEFVLVDHREHRLTRNADHRDDEPTVDVIAIVAVRVMDDVSTGFPAASSNDGEFDTSTTTDAPVSASRKPSPVTAFTSVEGAAATASSPCSVNASTNFGPVL
jgi:hypothetical protein